MRRLRFVERNRPMSLKVFRIAFKQDASAEGFSFRREVFPRAIDVCPYGEIGFRPLWATLVYLVNSASLALYISVQYVY